MTEKQSVDNWYARNVYENCYVCEPSKNIECNKGNCFMNDGSCYLTLKKEFAKD